MSYWCQMNPQVYIKFVYSLYTMAANISAERNWLVLKTKLVSLTNLRQQDVKHQTDLINFNTKNDPNKGGWPNKNKKSIFLILIFKEHGESEHDQDVSSKISTFKSWFFE